MALFPDTLAISYDLEIKTIYTVDRSSKTDGLFSQRNNRSPFGALHELTLKCETLTSAEIKALYKFYCDCGGSWTSFSIYDPDPDPNKYWTDVYLGTGDGSTGAYNLKGKNTSVQEIKVAGSVVDSGLWTITPGNSGNNYQDILTFVGEGSEPGVGEVIKVSFYGQRYFPNCIFKDSELSITTFAYRLYRAGVAIEEIP